MVPIFLLQGGSGYSGSAVYQTVEEASPWQALEMAWSGFGFRT